MGSWISHKNLQNQFETVTNCVNFADSFVLVDRAMLLVRCTRSHIFIVSSVWVACLSCRSNDRVSGLREHKSQLVANFTRVRTDRQLWRRRLLSTWFLVVLLIAFPRRWRHTVDGRRLHSRVHFRRWKKGASTFDEAYVCSIALFRAAGHGEPDGGAVIR